MNVSQHHPMDVIELAPEAFMLPLNDALTEEQHREILTEQERKVRRLPLPWAASATGSAPHRLTCFDSRYMSVICCDGALIPPTAACIMH